ncbi:MAG: cbb3-type cytochrome c oxidase subunit II [Candidatus Melainabacteria bacterium]
MEKRFDYLIAGSFIVLIFLTIIFVTAILPATTFQPEATEAAYDYSKNLAAKRGRDIYRREGCFYCHTQFTRYQDRESGEMVRAGDYVYETPHVLGTERTGPDLSNIGGKYPDEWHWAHHVNPRKVKPGSIMPSYSYLSHQDMSDLIAYLQTIGTNREKMYEKGIKTVNEQGHEEWEVKPITWIEAPQEIRDEWKEISENIDVNNSAMANSGRGIYMQNCAQCHGVTGRGNGPVSRTMIKKPANLTRPFFKAYSDEMYYYRVKEGVTGTRMPRWGRALSQEQMAYLVAYIKTLPVDSVADPSYVEVTRFDQIDKPEDLNHNYQEIEALKEAHHESRYVYGGGRH